MIQTQHHLRSAGTRIAIHGWEQVAPRAVLLICHGFGEHGVRYARLARDLGSEGIASFAVDLRGHGIAEGERGAVRRFAELTADLDRARVALRARLPARIPVFLLGHSMGGLVALRHLQNGSGSEYAGAILSAPLLGIAVRAPLAKRILAQVLSRVAPDVGFEERIDPEALCADPEVIAALEADVLVHSRITPRMYTEMHAAIRQARLHAGQIRTPLLFLIPEEDRVVRADRTREFAASIQSDAETVCLPGMRHEPLNEIGREAVIHQMTRWMNARTA